MSRSVQVVLLNESTVLTDDQARAIVAALRVQVHRDFSPIWGIDADLIYMSREGLSKLQNLGQNAAQLYPNAWQLVLLDNSAEAGALGYHQTSPTGQPMGFVGCKTDLDYGYQMSVTISHELLEMLADPWIMNTVFIQSTDKAGRIWSLEVADACEDDRWGYKIGDILVSDFVTPAYFQPGITPRPTLDFCGHISVPLTLITGGYMNYFDVPGGSGWQQLNAELVPAYKLQPPSGCRRFRRANQAKGAAA